MIAEPPGVIVWFSKLWCHVGWHLWIGDDLLQRCKYHPNKWRIRRA